MKQKFMYACVKRPERDIRFENLMPLPQEASNSRVFFGRGIKLSFFLGRGIKLSFRHPERDLGFLLSPHKSRNQEKEHHIKPQY
jgi:hypothetical protein